MDFEAALVKLEDQLQQAATIYEEIDLLNELAWHYCLKTPEKSRITLDKVRSALSNLDYPRGEHDLKTVMARHHFMTSEYRLSLELCAEAAAFYREHHEARWLCWALSIEGMIMRVLGNFASALEVAQEHYRVAKHSENLQEMSIALNAMGVGAQHVQNYEEALRYFNEAYDLAASISDHYASAIMLNNRAGILVQMGQFDEAIHAAHHVLDVLRTHEYSHEQALPMRTLGQAHEGKQEYHAAEKWFKARIDLLQDGRPTQLAVARLNLAALHVKMERPDDAIRLLQDILAFAEENNSPRHQFACHQHLADAYEQRGEYAKALHHHRQFHAIKERIFNEESDERLKNLQTLFDVERAKEAVAAEKLKRERDRLHYEQLSQIKDEFVGEAAHDLRNPLAAIFTSVDLLERHYQAGHLERIPDAIVKIRYHARRMQELITDLFDLARLETNHNLNRQPVSLRTLISTVRENNSHDLAARRLKLDVTHPPDDIILQADATQLQRVFDNLISNAIKFTLEGGEIRIDIQATPETVTIVIADTGIGIAEEDIGRIFERFFRAANASGDNAIKGTGLGLSIVQTIVRQHGGEIHVSSQIDVGTTFTIILPR